MSSRWDFIYNKCITYWYAATTWLFDRFYVQIRFAVENIPACEIKSSNLEGCFTLKEWDADKTDFQSRITAVPVEILYYRIWLSLTSPSQIM